MRAAPVGDGMKLAALASVAALAFAAAAWFDREVNNAVARIVRG